MQALFDAAKSSVQEIGKGARETEVYKEECLKLGRYVCKVTLILAELELQLYTDESLRGSKDMFIAAEAVLGALQQAASLVNQCSSTSAGRIWPMEDAVEFQSVALELLNAMEKVASAQFTFPQDLEEDVEHFLRQLKTLKFTEAELEESEEVELKALQKENQKAREYEEQNEDTRASLGVQTPTTRTGSGSGSASGSGSGSLPSGTFTNIKAFRSAAAASAAAVEELDDTWEEIEHEEEEDEVVEEGKQNEETITNDEDIESQEVLNNDDDEEKEETFENIINENQEKEEGEAKNEIPPPDEKLIQVLDTQGVAYVNLDNPTETIMPPGVPVKGAVENLNGEDLKAELPSDPFKMQEGAEAQVVEDARLGEETIQELEELKKGPDSSVGC